MMISPPSKKESLAVLPAFIASWFLLAWWSGLFSGGFQLVDDVILADYYQRLQQHNFLSVFTDVFTADLSIRLRPVALLDYLALAKIFGLNYSAILSYNLLIASLSCFIFYYAIRRTGFSILQSLLFVAILYMGNQGCIGIRVVFSENIAMLFLALCYWQLSQKKATGSIVFFTLAALTKESFLLLSPAIVWADFLLSRKNSFKNYLQQHLYTVSFFIAITAGLLLIILFKVGSNSIGYAGVDASTFAGRNLSVTAGRLFISKGYLLALLPAIFFITRKQGISFFKQSKPVNIILLLLLIAIPQVLLFSKSLIHMHYLMPGMLWSALAVIITLKYLQKNHSPTEINIYLSAVLALLVFNSWLLTKNARVYARDGKENRMMFESIREKTKHTDSILVIGHPFRDFERAPDAAGFLSSYLYERKNISILPSKNINDGFADHERSTADEFFSNHLAFITRQNDILSSAKCILYMPGTFEEAQKLYPAYLDPAKFNQFYSGAFIIACRKN